MENILKGSDEASPVYCTEVAVIGGGISGVMAAAAAAKSGAKTLLIESSPFLGGVVTMGPLEAFMTFHDESGRIVSGIAQEFAEIIQETDSGACCIKDSTGYCNTIMPYDAETVKYAIWQLLERYKVEVLLETLLTDVAVEHGKILSLRLETKAYKIMVYPGAVIDCTGAGNCARKAGGHVMTGRETDGKSQPVTVLARIGDVDIQQLKEYIYNNQENFQCFTGALDLESANMHLWGFSDLLERGYEEGVLSLKREEMHMMLTLRSGEVILNFSRVDVQPNKAAELSKSQYTGMKQVHEILYLLGRHIEAFKSAYIVQTGYVGIRESGRVTGRYILKREDIIEGKMFKTNVAKGAFPIDIHQPEGSKMQIERVVKAYGIPQECLQAANFANLFMAGRCISATYEAIASARISVTCMATGHAAGVMAAVYVNPDCAFDYEAVSELLKKQNALF